ncbi:DMT family transporter [Mycobacterium montefiorense]|uniref:Multidrug resistance protein mmr n=1 Tax=Mycobacterium montefiorense TaxID=154654 RepID=A0AA37UZA3_9MYCO|nr:SMR family transporter [Mycobacterium montefiorense]GBG36689.1 multidrug resistance protein mmr [Mycobacterium montefiorense]GKU37039.1 multidrug resistance protein mmr [Mycobacterium montefiorense]GKU43056.1 multidrug resistance protein mmr [Mycobacterium montefiorense]GKU48633.1 multidrug resistance protein mmr [Mycobacterium montefiorense]GKU50663.1 multidrug resistance protein mmr [Mycobacterium montefiorense]
MTYLFLLGAVFADVAATSLLSKSRGFTRAIPTLTCVAGYALSFALMAQAISRGIPTEVAYALFEAIGTTTITIIAVRFLGGPVSAVKITGIALIVVGVVVVNLAGSH